MSETMPSGEIPDPAIVACLRVRTRNGLFVLLAPWARVAFVKSGHLDLVEHYLLDFRLDAMYDHPISSTCQ
jgi:hypothetical protein